MSNKRHFYSEEERLSILRDYYSSGMSMYACAKKYQLSTETLLIKWKKLYESNVTKEAYHITGIYEHNSPNSFLKNNSHKV